MEPAPDHGQRLAIGWIGGADVVMGGDALEDFGGFLQEYFQQLGVDFGGGRLDHADGLRRLWLRQEAPAQQGDKGFPHHAGGLPRRIYYQCQRPGRMIRQCGVTGQLGILANGRQGLGQRRTLAMLLIALLPTLEKGGDVVLLGFQVLLDRARRSNFFRFGRNNWTTGRDVETGKYR